MVAPTSEADSSAQAVWATFTDVVDVVAWVPVDRVVVLDTDDPAGELEHEASETLITRVRKRTPRTVHGR
jgi:hypothetical protein